MKSIVLDLDNTLINAVRAGDRIFKSKKNPHYFYSDYVIYERDNLQPFLNFLFDNFNVGIWTAADKDYADFVVDNIIAPKGSGRHVDFVFDRCYCKLSVALFGSPKDLRLLNDYNFGKKYRDSMIIDDSLEVFETQRSRTIRIPPFYMTEPPEEDNALYQVYMFLMKIACWRRDGV